MVLVSAVAMYLTRRTVEKKVHAQQALVAAARKQAAEKRSDAIIAVLKWVHKVHQAVYFAEVTAQRALPGQPDNSGWDAIAGRLDALAPCPSESGLLPESLGSMVARIEPQLAEIKTCVRRHRESLALVPYGTPSAPMLSEQELAMARKALAADLEGKTRAFNLFMETLEKHFDAAFFGTTQVRLHKGRNE
jgi:hypothetical protein